MWKVLFISSECCLYSSAETNSEEYVVELIAVFAGTRLLLLGQQIDTEEAICGINIKGIMSFILKAYYCI